MKMPASFISDLDHRMTALLSFTLRRNSDFFGPDHGETKGLGDLYRASQEGAGTMLRALIGFFRFLSGSLTQGGPGAC